MTKISSNSLIALSKINSDASEISIDNFEPKSQLFLQFLSGCSRLDRHRSIQKVLNMNVLFLALWNLCWYRFFEHNFRAYKAKKFTKSIKILGVSRRWKTPRKFFVTGIYFYKGFKFLLIMKLIEKLNECFFWRSFYFLNSK